MKSRGAGEDNPLGTLEEQVMLAVIRAGDDAFAMRLRQELERLTARSVAIGSIYVTLDRLEVKGLIASSRAQCEDAISRRLFVVTPAGVRALSVTRMIRERLWEGVDLRRLLRNA